MDAEENQKQVSLRAHSPWKSQKQRFPHSHRPDDDAGGKVEIQKQDPHFPTGSIPLFQNQRKETWRRIASLPPPGSFFNENMLEGFQLSH
jgi:hypothetical protein